MCRLRVGILGGLLSLGLGAVFPRAALAGGKLTLVGALVSRVNLLKQQPNAGTTNKGRVGNAARNLSAHSLAILEKLPPKATGNMVAIRNGSNASPNEHVIAHAILAAENLGPVSPELFSLLYRSDCVISFCIKEVASSILRARTFNIVEPTHHVDLKKQLIARPHPLGYPSPTVR